MHGNKAVSVGAVSYCVDHLATEKAWKNGPDVRQCIREFEVMLLVNLTEVLDSVS